MGESPSQLMEARSIIEGELVVLACARITDSVLARLRELLKSMGAEIERRRARVDLDREFHVTLTEVTRQRSPCKTRRRVVRRKAQPDLGEDQLPLRKHAHLEGSAEGA